MSQFMQFVVNHWGLWLLFTAVFAAVIAYEIYLSGKGAGQLAVQEAVRMINDRNPFLFDMRNQSDYDKGHIIGAKLISDKDAATFAEKFSKHKTQPIIIYCENGSQSRSFAEKLKKSGFTDIHGIKGGLIGWREAEMPLSKK